MILVGNKCDLSESRIVTSEEGQKTADSLGAQYFETSAKDNINVSQAFETLVDEISGKITEHPQNDTGQVSLESKQRKCCCK